MASHGTFSSSIVLGPGPEHASAMWQGSR